MCYLMSYSFSASPLLSVTLGPKIKGHLALDSTFFLSFHEIQFLDLSIAIEGENKKKKQHSCVLSFTGFVNFSPYFNVLIL